MDQPLFAVDRERSKTVAGMVWACPPTSVISTCAPVVAHSMWPWYRKALEIWPLSSAVLLCRCWTIERQHVSRGLHRKQHSLLWLEASFLKEVMVISRPLPRNIHWVQLALSWEWGECHSTGTMTAPQMLWGSLPDTLVLTDGALKHCLSFSPLSLVFQRPVHLQHIQQIKLWFSIWNPDLFGTLKQYEVLNDKYIVEERYQGAAHSPCIC